MTATSKTIMGKILTFDPNLILLCYRSPGDSHMKVTGMLVVSLRGVNCRFWSHLGCSGQKGNIFTHAGIS